MREKYKYLGKNTIIFAISSFGTKFLSFMLVPLYTNVLSTNDYGIADLITTTATLLMFIFTVNIGDSVMRFSLEQKDKQKEILSFGLRVLILGTIALSLCLTIFSQLHVIDWKYSYYIFIFLYFFFMALYQILSNYLRAIDKIIDVGIAGIISAIMMIVGNIVFLLIIKLGINGYLISIILSPLFGSIYCIVKVKIPLNFYVKKVCNKDIQKEMFVFCIPLIFNNIALWINAFLDKFFVTAYCGIDQNGIYAVANKIPIILSTCYTVFSQAWNLSAIKEYDKDDKEGFFSNTYNIYNSVVVLICSVLIFINNSIASILFANDFFEAWKYSSVLLIAVMFNSLTIFLGSIFSAVKNSKIIATTTLISAGTNIILNTLLIPIFGVLGAAVATAISYSIMWIVRYHYSKKFIKLKINLLKDICAYVLLAFQVVCEHMENHNYMGQTLIISILFILYWKNIKKIMLLLINKIKSKAW